jgi:phosphopantothenoylcysteine decarboxylase/phosphopantothenate--cysteine ligase
VQSAQQMLDAVLPLAPRARRLRRHRRGGRLAPAQASEHKIKKDGSGQVPTFELTENPDILATVARCRGAAALVRGLCRREPRPGAHAREKRCARACR